MMLDLVIMTLNIVYERNYHFFKTWYDGAYKELLHVKGLIQKFSLGGGKHQRRVQSYTLRCVRVQQLTIDQSKAQLISRVLFSAF